MPVDAIVMAATDPETLLGLGAGVARGMPHTVCAPFWEYEFEVPDFNKFSDLARAPRHVADLHAATGGRPERSARWREFQTLMDVGAELRATFNAGGRSWGLLHLNRAESTHGFQDEEVAFVATVAPIVGRALRRSLVSQPASSGGGRAPGMAIVDGENHLVSATPEALEWFDQLETILAGSPRPTGGAERGDDGRAGGAGARSGHAHACPDPQRRLAADPRVVPARRRRAGADVASSSSRRRRARWRR